MRAPRRRPCARWSRCWRRRWARWRASRRGWARRRAALLDARPGLETSELLRSVLDKVALPRLRARVSAAYMYYDKAAHAVR